MMMMTIFNKPIFHFAGIPSTSLCICLASKLVILYLYCLNLIYPVLINIHINYGRPM